jgi:CheY-like chemotaxis protein/MinD-like ATPase involved in chromosome partitioning or flagellar assembly
MPEYILIVDDDIDTLKLVGLMLERKGYEIIAANNGKKALKLAKSNLPDLILLDIMMPEMDGYEVARKLRADPETENIPIIMFTAKSQAEDKIEGLEAGADAYITKPTQPRELFAQVKAILKRTPKRPPPTPSSPRDTGTIIGVLAAKGGIGVSTLATNLAVSIFKETGDSTILSDYRPGQGTISLDLGYETTAGFINILESDEPFTIRDLEGNLIHHKSGIKIMLSSPHPKYARYITHLDTFVKLTGLFRQSAAYTVLDLGASLPPLTMSVLELCDHIILCMEPVPNNVQQTKDMFQAMVEHGLGEGRITNVLINRQRTSIQLSWEQVEEQFGRTIATVFTPVPELAYQASRANNPMIIHDPDSITAQQFNKLTSLLL